MDLNIRKMTNHPPSPECNRPSGHFFFRARFAFFHTHASLLTSFVCFFILFHSCCSHAQVFGKTLVHEFPIAILNATLFFRSVMAMNNWKRSGIKQIILLLIKCYHIMFIIILFTLDFDELFSRFFYCLSKENSHGM